jgi:hypothetical protein
MDTIDGRFQKVVGEDLSAFSDMRIRILDEIEEQNKVVIRWNLKTTLHALNPLA